MNASAQRRRERRRHWLWWVLAALFVLVPIAEVYLLVQLGQAIGAWWTVLVLVADGDARAVAVRAGTHCTQPLLQRFGVTATCRASFAMYNTLEEVDVLADALISARRIFG